MIDQQVLHQPHLGISDFSNAGTSDCSMPLVQFVGSNFIPNHVELKSPAGRTHYHAILKHVITPELVDRLFTPYQGPVNGRLRAISGWPYLDDVRLCDITSEHVVKLTTSATALGYSHQTVKHIRNVVSAIFNHARREKILSENPITDVYLPPTIRRTNLSVVQAQAILKLMEYPERDIALLTTSTGLKISEICALQWKHLNLGRRRTYVDGVWIPPGCMVVMKYWKGPEVREIDAGHVRGIAIPAPLARTLLRLKQQRNPSTEDCFLISDQDGQPVAPARVGLQKLKSVGRTLGMPWLSWQALRRTPKNYIEDSRIQSGIDLDSPSLASATADAKPTAIHHWESSSTGSRSRLEMTPSHVLPQGVPAQGFIINACPKPKIGLVRVACSQLFAGFSESECVDIASQARERSFKRDELLFSQGDPVENLVLLRSGTVKHTQISSDGNEAILRISCGGDVLTFQGLSSAPEHSCTVRATEICEALVWDYREIERLFATYPKLRTNVDRILIAQLVELEKRYREMATERAPGRLALLLLRLHKQIGKNHKHRVVLSFSREELAQMTGTTVFTVSRLLSRWSELGLVVARREEVIVKDDERLLRIFAEGGDQHS